jgi:hypothetical protein
MVDEIKDKAQEEAQVRAQQEKEAREQYDKVVQDMKDNALKQIEGAPTELVIKLLVSKFIELQMSIQLAFNHINQLGQTMGTLVTKYYQNVEAKSPVFSTLLDHKDLIIEKDDDDNGS